MKKPILIAAGLTAATVNLVSLGRALADTAYTSPGITGTQPVMFSVNANTAGVLQFAGTGTAQFNNQTGTSNNFNVGSSTNLGVNASVSSTPDYDSTSTARLNLVGGSTLMQTIGTATSAANTQASSQAASSAASSAAFEATNSSKWGSSYDAYYDSHWDVSANAGSGGWEAGYELSGSSQAEYESKWQSEWENTYQQKWDSAYSTATSTSSTTANNQTNTGVISGSFVSKEVGNSQTTANSTAVKAAAETAASAAMTQESGYGTWAAYEAANTDASGAWNSGATYTSEASWNAAYATAYNAAAQSAAASSGKTSQSDVTVTGIGSIANVIASGSSDFKVDLTNMRSYQDERSTTATANGSAGAQLATSSYANQANATTASAFIQAFSGAPKANHVDLTTDGSGNVTGGNLSYKESIGTFTNGTTKIVDASGAEIGSYGPGQVIPADSVYDGSGNVVVQ